jgi:hypothetical protein
MRAERHMHQKQFQFPYVHIPLSSMYSEERMVLHCTIHQAPSSDSPRRRLYFSKPKTPVTNDRVSARNHQIGAAGSDIPDAPTWGA